MLYQKYLCSSIYWPGAVRGSISHPGCAVVFLSHFGGGIFRKAKQARRGERTGIAAKEEEDCLFVLLHLSWCC